MPVCGGNSRASPLVIIASFFRWVSACNCVPLAHLTAKEYTWQKGECSMKIKWLGHACFLITSTGGIRIITDPYQPGQFGINYAPIDEVADIVTVSHEHADHNYIQGLPGSPLVVKETGVQEIEDITIKGIAAYHDDSGGSQRGSNTIFCFTINGINLCHLGDLGHQLSAEQIAQIGEVDILLTPVADTILDTQLTVPFTIGAELATRICEQIKPRVIIPMHYRTEKCPSFPVTGVEPFLAGKENVRMVNASEAEFVKEQLPLATEVVVLAHAL